MNETFGEPITGDKARLRFRKTIVTPPAAIRLVNTNPLRVSALIIATSFSQVVSMFTSDDTPALHAQVAKT